MRQHLAKLAPAILVGGCSLIYNPSNIDKPMHDGRMVDMDFPVDVEIRADAMPRDLTITEAFPTTIAEGSGTGGSRPAIVVIKGHNFVKDAAANLQVMLTPTTAGAALLDSFEVSGNGDFIAVAVNVPIATTCGEGTSVGVGVTVMQNDLMGGTVSQTMNDAFSVQCLEELDTLTTTVGLKSLYSRINISGAVDFPAAVAGPAILRSASSISVGAIDASATGREPGPGGGRGGDHESNAMPATGPKPGGQGTGASGGGGGGGYAMSGGAGTGTGAGAAGGVGGDIWISSYATNASSGGGGGGDPITLGTGGVGGGGGGTLELTAPGTITVGAITATGGNGTDFTGASGGAGGGGTGGTVVIRAGAMLTASTVTVTKGAPPASSSGGTSSDGRVRADVAVGNYPAGATKGPMFVDLPTRTTIQIFSVSLRGTPNDQTSSMRVFDKAGLVVASMTYMPLFGTAGTASQPITLKAGYNRVCVYVGTDPSVPEATNCEEIAYLPP